MLPAAIHERIALTIAEINGRDYRLSARAYLGQNVAKLDDTEMIANLSGVSNDIEADAAVRFASKVVRQRGDASDEDCVP